MKKTTKILILDDSEEDTKKIIQSLIDDGFETPVMSCGDKDSFLIQLDEFNPDLIISEHSVKGYNTFNALEDSRRVNPDVIFILTASDIPEEFALALLKEGVDDYVFKNHLIRLPYAIENAYIKRQYVLETKKLAEMNENLRSANCAIEDKNMSLTQSIVFAERIQSLILPNPDVLLDHFREAFIIYKPKDIVSGDFYWVDRKEESVMVAAADSTGHGVPGALLSIIGTNFLNEIAEDKHNFTHPSDILSLLDLNLRSLLKQDVTNGYHDGIDIAFVTIDKTHKKLYFSGCKRPLFIYRRRDKDMIQYKGEPYLIGGGDKGTKKTFATQEIPYGVGDVIYMFSDGVVDQFGGPMGKKLMKKRFVDILMSFKHLSLTYQKQLLDQKLKSWQGDEEQTDDIIIIGIKL